MLFHICFFFHFPIGFHTIWPLFATTGVTLCWPLQRLQLLWFFCFSDVKARPIFYIQPAKLTHSCMLFEHTLNPYWLSCMLRQHEWFHFLFRHPEVFILYNTNSTHFKTGIFISLHISFIPHPPRQLHYHLNRICLCSHIMFPELCASCPSLTAVHLDF